MLKRWLTDFILIQVSAFAIIVSLAVIGAAVFLLGAWGFLACLYVLITGLFAWGNCNIPLTKGH